jgi:hypothetical protein
VFVSASVSVRVALGVAQHRLLHFLRVGDLDSLATHSYTASSTVASEAIGAGLAKTITIESIPAYQRGATTVVPIRWHAAGPLGGAFPVLDANIELSANASGSEILVIGSYRPPLGDVGAVVDRLLLHRVAESTIRHFVEQLADVAIAAAPALSNESGREPFALDPDGYSEA